MSREDASSVAKFLQGLLVGMIEKSLAQGLFPLRVEEIRAPQDGAGNYKDHFILITKSGIRLKVTVEPEGAE